MTNEELSALEEKIVAQCEKRKAEGWAIERGACYVTPLGTAAGACRACALGTFAEARDARLMSSYAHVARRELGITPDEACAFAIGFDCRPYDSDQDPHFYALGQRVAARVL